MKLQSAISLEGDQKVSILLATANVEHSGEQVGNLLVLAVAESLKSECTDHLRFVFDVEPNSEIDMERFTVDGTLDIDLSQFDDLDALNKHIKISVQDNLISQAVSLDRTNTSVSESLLEWKNNGSIEPFDLEAPDSFNIIDLASATANLICLHIEKYFILAKAEQEQSLP